MSHKHLYLDCIISLDFPFYLFLDNMNEYKQRTLRMMRLYSSYKMFSNQLFLQFVLFQTIISANRDNFLVVSTTQSPSVPDHARVQLELLNIMENKFQQLEERMSRRMEQKEEEMKFHERQIENQEKIMKMLQESQRKLEDNVLRRMEQVVQETQTKVEAKLLVECEKNQEQLLKSFDNLLKNHSEIHSRKDENSTDQLPSYQEKPLPKDCREVQERGGTELVLYTIQPDPKKEGFQVWCDVETRGGGWIHVMGRSDYSQPFNLSWSEYKKGFGSKLSGYWLGLENLYTLTGNNSREMLIEAVTWDKKKVYAHYKQFAIGNEQEEYAIKIIRDYDGDDDCFSNFFEMKFSTYDRDHDFWKSGNCAGSYGGGFWYDDCLISWGFTSSGDRKMRSTFGEIKELKMMIR